MRTSFDSIKTSSTYTVDSTYNSNQTVSPAYSEPISTDGFKKDKLDLSEKDYTTWTTQRLLKELNIFRHAKFSLENQIHEYKMEREKRVPFEERKYTKDKWFSSATSLAKSVEERIFDVESALGIENMYVRFFNHAKSSLDQDTFNKLHVLSDKRLKR
jgi:hypothetical protein